MPSFSFTQTKVALTVVVALGLTTLAAGVISLEPNRETRTMTGFQKPPPLASLLEGCGNFYSFDAGKIDATNGDTSEGKGTIIPLTPVDKSVEALPLDAIRYYKLEEIKKLPTVDEFVATVLEHKAFIVWYAPGTPNDALDSLASAAKKSGERIIIAPWTGGVGGEDRKILPQARNFAYMSYNQITQSCSAAEPYSLQNFISYANSLAVR